jgi:hypothetical protein
MHFVTNTLLLAQFTADDLRREVERIVGMEEARLHRNYEFLGWGYAAALVILVGYVLMMVARERTLKREIANLKAMLEEKK